MEMFKYIGSELSKYMHVLNVVAVVVILLLFFDIVRKTAFNSPI